MQPISDLVYLTTVYSNFKEADQCIDKLFEDATNKAYSFDLVRDASEQTLQQFDIRLAAVRNPRDYNKTLLHMAAGYGRKSWVRGLLLGEGADVNAQDTKGQAPLHAACNHAHKSIALQLIECGADVNIADDKGWTPLHFALARKENLHKIQAHYWELVELLLQYGADPYLKTKMDAVNCFARIKDSERRTCVRIIHLLNKLINCGVGSQPNREAIINKYLRIKDFFELVKIGDDNIDTLEKLLTKRLLNSRLETFDNITPLHRAAGHNHLKAAKLFIQSGADVNAADDHGRIPLHNAAQYGHIDMIELLVSEGSEVNKQDLEGRSPIHVAASNNRTYEACLKLIELGANKELKTTAGELPYELAELDDVREVLRSESLQRVRMIPSTSEQAIYIGIQESDSNTAQQQCFISARDDLMLDSHSEDRLFSNPKHQIKVKILDEVDQRYQEVKRRMLETKVAHSTDTGGIFSDYEIISIELILNEKVWSKYRLVCQKLDVEYGKNSRNERLLFHGSNFVSKIQLVGFDERYAQRDGMFGAGIYFAANSSKSNQYTFGFGNGCDAHKNKSCYLCERKMIYAQVALGRSLKSKEAMRCAHAPPGYSSVSGDPETTDDLVYPEYAIYNGDQAYPLFVITYRIKP